MTQLTPAPPPASSQGSLCSAQGKRNNRLPRTLPNQRGYEEDTGHIPRLGPIFINFYRTISWPGMAALGDMDVTAWPPTSPESR